MRIGIPTETKALEGRVGLIPAACSELIQQDHQLFLQAGAGRASGYSDEDYRRLGVEILPDAEALYGTAEMIIKIKEPQAAEIPLLRADHLLFCFLHLAAEPRLLQQLLDLGLTAVAFETVESRGGLPLLAPMSVIAGRIAIQRGTVLLHRPEGGRGLLLGGLPGSERGEVVVFGGGNAGGQAAALAAALGARVTLFDKRMEQLTRMQQVSPLITGLYPTPQEVDTALSRADLVVGAVLVTGTRAPYVVTRDQVGEIQPGSVIVDISVDQGGCIETTRPTSYVDPTYLEQGVTHFAVTNMPGAVPRSASQAMSAALIPYVIRLAQRDWEEDAELRSGLNVAAGKICHPALHDVI
ncbi:MAG: alanine dehydrogenase [Gammaproteobacteria bacterium]|nr:alanine dehydrogenase [Gammaproteobacteria bacterium]